MSVDAKIAALEQEIAELKQEKAQCADEAEQEWQDVWRYLFDVNGYVRCGTALPGAAFGTARFALTALGTALFALALRIALAQRSSL